MHVSCLHAQSVISTLLPLRYFGVRGILGLQASYISLNWFLLYLTSKYFKTKLLVNLDQWQGFLYIFVSIKNKSLT